MATEGVSVEPAVVAGVVPVAVRVGSAVSVAPDPGTGSAQESATVAANASESIAVVRNRRRGFTNTSLPRYTCSHRE